MADIAEVLKALRESFEKAQARGDAAYYVRPEWAWMLLETAEAAEEARQKEADSDQMLASIVEANTSPEDMAKERLSPEELRALLEVAAKDLE